MPKTLLSVLLPLLLLLPLVGLAAPDATPAAPPYARMEGEPLSLPTAIATPTLLHKRLHRHRPPPRPAPSLNAWLFRPAATGPRPALVLLPDCRGPRSYQSQWARQLSDWGYVALLVDSFGSRGASDTCNRPRGSRNHVLGLQQSYDAFAARDFLATRPEVDPLRIGIMGWSRHAVLSTILRDGVHQFFGPAFKAALAFGPDCGIAASARLTSPLLILSGQMDDWSPAPLCARLSERSRRSGASIEFHAEFIEYPAARHGFDDPAALNLDHASNPYRNPALGATLAYQAEATALAREQVRDFLERQLVYSPFRGSLDDLPPAFDREQAAAAAWAVDPAALGPDLPPRGRSTFDQLFSRNQGERRVYDIPFPFSRIITRIRDQLTPDDSLREPVSAVLIPRGRSLQREAAAPDYFRYPRIVIGTSREPLEDDQGRRLLLKDRLFIGYVESTDVLEVISHNPQADRFEYQLVRDYRAGGEPVVYYAPRRLCLACHQNHAPIFANAPWDETNANRDVMRGLAAVRQDYQGLPALALGNSANNLDRSANRATLFAVHALLWRQLCAPPRAAACRAAWIRAVLQYRLSGANGFDRDNPSYQHDFVEAAAQVWDSLWPQGLKIPFANLPDRDAIALLGDIPVGLDPLTRREPEFIWSWDPATRQRLVAGLSERLLAADVDRLDRWLRDQAATSASAWRRLDCRQSLDRHRGVRFPVQLNCRAADAGGVLDLRLDAAPAIAGAGEILLYEAEPGQRLVALDISRETASIQTAFGIFNRRDQRSVRLPDGRRVAALRLTPAGDQRWTAEIRQIDDFGSVDRALSELAADPASHLARADGFDSQHLMYELLAKLGAERVAPCCDDGPELPPPELEPTHRPATDADPLLGLLDRYCSDCHASAARLPPPFLRGSTQQVQQQLLECAERINFRLAMWAGEEADRARSPMPPLAPESHTAASWAASEELRRLRDLAAGLLGGDADLAGSALTSLLGRRYADLNHCDPASAEDVTSGVDRIP